MERAEDKRLTELREKGYQIYSISRLNTMNQCPYQAYLNYVQKEKGVPNIWALMGGHLHDALQECIDTGCDERIVAEAIDKELENLDMLGIEFPLDRNKQPTIRNNWVFNMTEFAKHFKTPKGNFETEQLILYPINDHAYLQGYIDLIRYNDDGSLWILDWKTSSAFVGEHLIEAGRQLIFYALAKQLEGFEIKRISWVMLKYCVTKWQLKNGKTKEKVSEWRNYISDLRPVLEKKLQEAGYDDLDAEILLDECSQKCSLEPLPEPIKNQFHTSIYVRDYEFSQENIDETLNYINAMIKKYEEAGEDENNYPPCDIAKSSYFCSSLCGYSNKCKYYSDYKSQFIKEGDDDDSLF